MSVLKDKSKKLLDFTLIAGLVLLVFYLLIVGQDLLLPLVIAFVFWFLINTLAKGIRLMGLGEWRLPLALCYFLSICLFIAMIWALIKLVSMNIDGVVSVAPAYQANFERRILGLLAYFGLQQAPTLAQLSDVINLREIITAVASSLTGIAASGGVILIYLLFLLLEQGALDRKLTALINDTAKEKKVRQVFHQIDADVRKYIGIKVFTSLTTALLSYLVLIMIGVDFSEFWAVLIFLLNFIPTIGSIIATVFPALITLVQFESLTPFFLVISVVTAIQFLIGNVLEPRLMGNSLNLSPMVILLSLGLWGMIWGIPGMFLCVPFLVISMIVFSHMPSTRVLAVLLSRDGQVNILSEEGAGDQSSGP